MSDSEIAKRLGRDSRTVHKQLELAEQEKENSAKTTALDSARTHQLIQKLRLELESLSPIQLLQRRLEAVSQDALSDFFCDNDTKKLYHEAKRHHFERFNPERLYLRVQSDPVFQLLHLKFPTSAVWTGLEAWGRQAVPCLSTFYDILYDLKTVVNYVFDEEGIDDSDL